MELVAILELSFKPDSLDSARTVMTRVLEDSISREMISVDPHMAAWTAAAVNVSPRPASRASAVE